MVLEKMKNLKEKSKEKRRKLDYPHNNKKKITKKKVRFIWSNSSSSQANAAKNYHETIKGKWGRPTFWALGETWN